MTSILMGWLAIFISAAIGHYLSLSLTLYEVVNVSNNFIQNLLFYGALLQCLFYKFLLIFSNKQMSMRSLCV